MTISPNYSLLHIFARVDQKMSDPRLLSEVPGEDGMRTVALEIVADLRIALDEVGRELTASLAKRRPS